MNRENLEKILNGLDLIREAIISEIENTDEGVISEIENTDVDDDFIIDDLSLKTLKELKELAKELGISTRGSAIDLILRISEVQDAVEEEFVLVGSDVRIEAVKKRFLEIKELLSNKELEISEVKEFLVEYYADNKSELKKVEAMDYEDLANKYCWIQANLIDDEGDEVDFNESYIVGDVPYCCGIPMRQIDETTYFCEIDGEEVIFID